MEEDILQSITCNKCGNTHKSDESNTFPDIYSLDVNFLGSQNHYLSKYWLFELCEDCLVGFVKTFQRAPDGFMNIVGEDAQQQFEKWVIDLE